jgi:hypothetical protein
MVGIRARDRRLCRAGLGAVPLGFAGCLPVTAVEPVMSREAWRLVVLGVVSVGTIGSLALPSMRRSSARHRPSDLRRWAGFALVLGAGSALADALAAAGRSFEQRGRDLAHA